LRAGTCPSKQKKINDEQFTLINLAAPWGRVGGRVLAQLSNKKFLIVNGSLQQICRTLWAGLGLGTCPTE
jgi:hypothetical protein